MHISGPVQTADLRAIAAVPRRFSYGSVSDLYFVLHIYTYLSMPPGLIAPLNM